MFLLIVFGIALLVAVSVGAGMVIAQERDRIASRRLAARRHQLWLWEQELLTAACVRGCPSCELLRKRAELQRPIGD